MSKKITTYQEDLIEALKDPREAAAYLNAAIEEGDRELFLLALRNVAEARGGMAALSQKSKLNRESLYRMLSRNGNPEIKSILTLLHAMGLKLSIEPQTRRSKSPKVKEVAQVTPLRSFYGPSKNPIHSAHDTESGSLAIHRARVHRSPE